MNKEEEPLKKIPLLATIVSLSLVSCFPSTSFAEEELTTFTEQEDLSISLIGRYDSGAPLDEGGAEIVDYDKKHHRAFVVNGADQSLDILDLTSPSDQKELSLLKKVSLKDIDLGGFVLGDLTSVAVHPNSEYVAVAMPAEEKTDPGMIALFETNGDFIKAYEVGALPDMVAFSPDGKQLLVANEGEPNDDYTIDPEGSVSVLDVSNGPKEANVNTIGFDSLDEKKIDEDVRVFGPGATTAQDFEPEYIQVTSDSQKAYVSLQENNAIAEIDLDTQTINSVNSLGFKDHSIEGNGLDVSNKSDEVAIKPMPVLGMYQPDAIALYTVEGKNYILTPNEGDARDYDGYSEESRVEDLEKDTGHPIKLNADNYEGYTQKELDQLVDDGLWDEDQLGRLNVTTANGLNKDGEYEALYSYGARSFSVYETEDFEQLYDSGDEFEQITSQALPKYFNSNNDDNGFKSRSDDKGPEPESAEVGEINGKLYAFIGLERQGGIMVYDIDHPEQPEFVTYFSSRDFSSEDESVRGDSAPEGIKFVSAENSPTGKPMLLAAHEVSGTVAAYEIESLLGEKRLAGNDRYETAVQVSKEGWKNAETVVIARGDEFADALAGAPLAYKEDAPILLTSTDHVNQEVKKEIERLGAKHAIILGGSVALSSFVDYQLQGLGLDVERIGGESRFDTATNIAARLDGNPDKAIIANGITFADALAAAPFAAKNGYPILLTEKDKLPSSTSLALKGIQETIVVGGDAVVTDDVFSTLPDAIRIGGANRFETAAIMATTYHSGNAAMISTGYEFADALTGSVLAAKRDAASLLVKKDSVPEATKEAFKQLDLEKLYLLGGTSAVSDQVKAELTSK